MRRAGWIVVAVLGASMLACGTAALAQLSPEGERRLEERQTGKPAKRGATTPAGQRGGRQPVFLWRTRPNAPWLYRAWVKRFREIRRENVAAYQDALDRELDVLRRIQLRPVERIYGNQYENGWKPSKIDSARKRKERLSTQEAVVAAMDRRIHDMANDPLYLPFPSLAFSEEAFGRLDKPIRIIGVADKSTCLARVDDQRFWLSGFDTTPFAEGQNVVVEVPLIVAGARPFTDDEGQTRSHPVVKPFEWVAYLEKYEVTEAEARAFWGPPIPPPPPKRLAVGPPPRVPDPPGGPPVGIIQPVRAKEDAAREGKRGKAPVR